MIAPKFSIVAKGDKAAEITIYGDIGYQYSFEQFHNAMNSLGAGREITVRINSDGGDVFTGFAIYNRLKRYKGKIITYVEGLAASMGSVIFMAGDERIMPENAMLMIHNPAGINAGNAKEMESFAKALAAMQDNLVKAYVDASGVDEKEVRAMMDSESWLTAAQAVDQGFATKVDAPVKMAAHAGHDLSRYKNVPTTWASTATAEENDMSDKDRSDEIKRICALVGKPHLADGFITDKKSVADVLASLDTMKKDDDAKAKAAADTKAAADAKTGDDKKPVDEAAIRAQVIEENREIASVCALAGFPDKANEFIAAGKTRQQVVAALDELKKVAAEQKGNNRKSVAEISTRHDARNDNGAGKVLDTAKVWDKFNKPARKSA